MNSEEQEIVTLSRKIVELELRKDADALAPYIADDYIGVDPSGVIAAMIFVRMNTAYPT